MVNMNEFKRKTWLFFDGRTTHTLSLIYIILSLIAYLTHSMDTSMGFLLLITYYCFHHMAERKTVKESDKIDMALRLMGR